MPAPLAAEPAGAPKWAASCEFVGSASPGGEKGALGDPVTAHVKGLGTFGIQNGRVFGIVAPSSPTDPALWLSWSLSALEIDAKGSQGIFKKRPLGIALQRNGGAAGADSLPIAPETADDGDLLMLKEVSRLYLRTGSGRYQTGQENDLLRAIRAPVRA
jgi:hypothetical protein